MRKLFLIFSIALFLLSFVGAQVVGSDGNNNFFGSRTGTASFVNYGSSFSSYYGSNANTYWPILSNRDSSCMGSQDILIQVSPIGCQPAVVRSDLLAEQNVPVFCQLDLLQVNPAINIKQIRNIRFGGRYPEYVAGVGFHPANAALRTTNSLLGTPLESNIGYVVVVLKRNPNEDEIPEFFNFTLSASIDYYSGNAVGIGATEMLLKETNNEEWEVAKNRQTLFGGKMSVRVKDTDSNNSIVLQLYSGDIEYSQVTLQKNSPQSNAVYLPGSYCQTALQFTYNDFVSPSAIARVQVDEDVLDLYEGSRFLNNKCLVRRITDNSVDINCGREIINLTTVARSFDVGERVYLVNAKFEVVRDKEYTISKINNEPSGTTYTLEGVEKPVSSTYLRPVSQEVLYEATYGEYEDYIVNATSYYETIANEYGNLRKQQELGEEYGEVALSAAIDLAIRYDKKVTADRLINKYIESYPNGKNKDRYVRALNDLYIKDNSLGTKSVQSDDGYHLFKLIDITPIAKKSNAKISWGSGPEKLVNYGETVGFDVGRITLVKVRDRQTVDISAVCNNRNLQDFNNSVRLGSPTVVTACGVSLRVNSIEFEDYVKLRVSPVTRSGTTGNFTVGIGIEKRVIELTPDKARKKIENLNKSIQKWEAISEKLGEVVTGLKTACFATAGVLTVKNFFTGLSGEALARRSVMSGDDGWTRFCQSEVNAGRQSSLTACYNANSADIRKDVNARVDAIEETNAVTKQVEDGAKYVNREGVFSGTNFDDNKAKEALIVKIKQECSSQQLGPKSAGASTPYNTVPDLFPAGYNVDSYSYTQLRDIYFNCKTINGDGSSRGDLAARSQLDSMGYSISERLKYDSDIKSLQTASSGTGLANAPTYVAGNDKAIIGEYYGGKVNALDFGLPSSEVGKPAQVVYYNSQPYLFVLKEEAGGKLVTDKVYSLSKEGQGYVVPSSFAEATTVKEKFSRFETRDSKSYNNKFAPGESTVRYFETEPYKGLPAVVPFDLNRGFYAATTQALPIFGGTKSYEDNGRPSSFFVCNVMKDSNIGFYSPNYGDDECVQFNIYTGQSFSSFPGLTEQETKTIVNNAIKALNEASQQYGKSSVRILGNQMNVGRAASLLPGSQCQDYMSPEDCKILFNVCDPVICPASRCNFGGEYYVSDVIQSGIVGSALLCLPNYKEGIVAPVCLTGIKAGIDGYLSILKSHQQCLQEAVDTGRYVGICDQISSVYLCEFFWRQAAPLAKTLLPKLVESVYSGGQGSVRGGGEYMTVASSWQNAQDSVSYFTQSYAVNSFEAFRVRSVEEAGTEICRAFISAKVPSSFDTLVEPDSPSQFHAWYSSIDYTDATVPATSQYKVFYHIFAGKDRGVSYSVYLRDPPSSSQYASAPIITVATGFVARGQYATESKDFTAPKGYQQLCVRINDKEECGFKQVSSSFAINYVRDKVVSDELTRNNIVSETECISGSVNPSALLNPNLQSAAEEAFNPAIYNRGIVRVCATSNPGSKTEPSRYVDVGYCGEERLRCWLDKNSLDEAISDINVGLKNQTLSEVETIQKGYLNEGKRYESSADLDSGLNDIKSDVDKVDKITIGGVITELDGLFAKAAFDHYKAEILLYKANAYRNAFINSLDKIRISNVPQGTSESVAIDRNDYTSVDSYGDFDLDAVYLHTASGKHYQVVSIDSEVVVLSRLLRWGVYDTSDSIEIFRNSGAEVFSLFVRYNGEGNLFDSVNSGSTISSSGKRILSFNDTYNRRSRSYILLDESYTGIYLLGSGIYLDENPQDIGSVSAQGKIRFLEAGRDIVKTNFGDGMYEFLNNRLWVTNIEGRCDLDILAVTSGVVITSCVKVPNCANPQECANVQGGNEEDYYCEEQMCYPEDMGN